MSTHLVTYTYFLVREFPDIRNCTLRTADRQTDRETERRTDGRRAMDERASTDDVDDLL